MGNGGVADKMPDANDFKTFEVQATIFTPGVHFRGAKVLGHFLSRHSQQFTGDPMSLPFPPGVAGIPLEMPQVVLKNDDSSLRLQAAPARVDVVKAGNELTAEAVQEFLGFAVDLFEHYAVAMQGKVGRVACVVHRLARHDNPARAIAEHFCREQWLKDPLNRPSDFEMHAAKKFLLGDLVMVNSWFRCKSARIRMGEGPEITGVFVEQDFNTQAEEAESRSFSPGDVRRFYELCAEEFRVVLQRYFPPGGRQDG